MAPLSVADRRASTDGRFVFNRANRWLGPRWRRSCASSGGIGPQMRPPELFSSWATTRSKAASCSRPLKPEWCTSRVVASGRTGRAAKTIGPRRAGAGGLDRRRRPVRRESTLDTRHPWSSITRSCLGVLSLSPSFMKEEADMPHKTKTNGSGVPERDTPPVTERGRGPFCEESGPARAPHVLLDQLGSEALKKVVRRAGASVTPTRGAGLVEGKVTDSGFFPDFDRCPALQMLRMVELARRTTLSCAQLYKLRKERKFPGPVELSPGVRAWPEFLVDAWLGSRMEARSTMVNLTDPVDLPLWTLDFEFQALANAPAGVQIVRRPDVLRRVSVRKTKLYDLIQFDGFPWPVPIGVVGRGWVLREVEDWLRARYERRCARDHGFAFLTRRIREARRSRGSAK